MAILHMFGQFFSLYWAVSGYDKTVHFLAGAIVGMSTLVLTNYLFPFSTKSKSILLSVLAAFLVGLLWELFELHYGITMLSDGRAYFNDTSTDLLSGLIGGLAGVMYGLKISKK